MNCIECGQPSPAETCAACAAEDRMYAAYRQSIVVPPLWSGIEKRTRPRRWQMPLAAAAMIAVLMIAATLVLLRAPRTAPPPSVATIAAAHYRIAIANLERRTADPLLPQLTAAIAAAERNAARMPSDPVEVTRLVAAYDAKLQLLRATAND
jgi:hypothetical protein